MAQPTFSQRVFRLLRQVPEGKVVTYGQIAVALEEPHAARTVGWAMRACWEEVPWWRIVGAGGRILTKGAEGGSSPQRAMLEVEGVTLDEKGNVSLTKHGLDADVIWRLAH